MRNFLASAVVALLSVSSAAEECTNGHSQKPCEVNVESPEFIPEPSSAPSAAPSVSPSVAPSAAPSAMPSTSPSDVPSTAPSDGECATQGGIYGDITAPIATTVEFGYSVEANTTTDDIRNNLIPLLETSIANSILSEVIAECADGATLSVDVAGVSINPEDSVLEDVACGETQSPDNSCLVVSGALTLYSTDAATAGAASDAAEAAIQDSMDLGEFDDEDDSIVRVAYVDLQSGNSDGSRAQDDPDASIGDDNSPILIGVLVAAGVVLAAGAAVAYKRHSDAAALGAASTAFGGDTTASPA